MFTPIPNQADYDTLLAQQSPDCLLVFVDETGVETFPSNQRYFAFAACAVLKKDHKSLCDEWEIKYRLPCSLHKGRTIKKYKSSLIGFLRAADFIRIGVCLTADSGDGTLNNALPEICLYLAEVLWELLNMSKPRIKLDSAVVIFEHSARIAHKGAFDAPFCIQDEKGKMVPVLTKFIEKKKISDHCLTIANLLAYSIGLQYRETAFYFSSPKSLYCAAFDGLRARFSFEIPTSHRG